MKTIICPPGYVMTFMVFDVQIIMIFRLFNLLTNISTTFCLKDLVLVINKLAGAGTTNPILFSL